MLTCFKTDEVMILGTPWHIKVKTYDEEPFFKEKDCDGYANCVTRELVLCDRATFPGCEGETEMERMEAMRATLRHEIVHAFLDESGLQANALAYDGSWCKNEEMVDWIAIQGPKLHAAWKQAGAL